MSQLLDAVNWTLLKLGDAAQWVWNDALGFVGEQLAWASETANPVLAPVFRGLSIVTNAVAGVLFAPIGMMPGWLSNTIISAVTGVVLLVLFKYTSNQKAIGRVKDRIKADMLALKLFKDSLSLTFRSQGRILLGATRLLRYSLFPLLVMIVPVSLELAQMGLWYQWRPLQPGETTLLTMKLADDDNPQLPPVRIAELPGAEVAIGPVRIFREREICWKIVAREAGRHTIVFEVGGEPVEKQLVIGDGPQRVSAMRPSRDWTAILLHPAERPFARDSIVQSISIDYPDRESWTSGTDWWLGYFFVASLVFALIFKPLIGVRI